MSEKQLSAWLIELKSIWEGINPEEAQNLVADTFKYYEEPFKKPLTNKQQLVNEWKSILDHKDVSLTYEILCSDRTMGIVKWFATFTRISSGENVEMEGIYQIKLNDEGKCTEFHQWFNTK